MHKQCKPLYVRLHRTAFAVLFFAALLVANQRVKYVHVITVVRGLGAAADRLVSRRFVARVLVTSRLFLRSICQ